MNTLVIIFTLLITFCSPVLAQKPSLKFQHLSLKEGLSQSTVNAILQDSKGFMWFGTQDGLNKYDGYKFTIYQHEPQNAKSLSHNEVFTLYEDSVGTLWIGTNGGGLNQFDRRQNNFIHYLHDPKNPNSLSHNTVLSIHEDDTGMLWISTNDGLNQFDRQQNTFISFKSDPKNPHSLSKNLVWPLYQDKSGILWIGTDGGGLNQFDRKLHQFTHYLPEPKVPNALSNVITSIYEKKMGALWIGTLGGLYKFDRTLKTFKSYLHDPKNPDSLSHRAVWSISEDRQGYLWVATDGGGINLFDRQTEKFRHELNEPQKATSLSHDRALSVYQDRAGTMWVGTGGGGVNYFNPQQEKFAHYRNEPYNANSLNNNHVLSIYEDKKGFLWVGTQGGGLNRFDMTRQSVIHYQHDPKNPHSLSHDEVHSIYEDSDGVLWVGTFGGGLNQFDKEENRFISFKHQDDNPDSLNNDYVLSIYEDSTKTLWIGTRKGLDQFDRQTNKFVHYVHEPGNSNSLSDEPIFSIYEDKKGVLWIGTYGGGLNQFDRQLKTFLHYQYKEQDSTSLSHNKVSAIYEDKTGRLWISTLGGGLNRFDRATGHFDAYREKDGLANDIIYGILEDNQGNLWLSSNKGLSRFNPKTEQFRNYDVLDGLQSNEFNKVAYKSRRGELFFGGINGFNAFFPELMKDNSYIPPIVITDFNIFNRSVSLGKNSPLQQHIGDTREITLSYKQSFFSFDFAALNFLLSSKNQYAYKLEGLDTDWNEIGNRHHASYTNVPHGSYLFRVKGSNNDNIWSKKDAAIKIIVLPPPWKTWWAYTLYILTILTVIIYYIRLQKRKLWEKQQELEHEKKIAAQLKEADRIKDEFLANTSHELRTPLNGIIGIAESLVDGATGVLSKATQSNLEMIVSSGRRLLSLVNDILDFSKLKKTDFDLQLKTVDICTISNVVLQLSQPLIGQKKVQLVNAIASELPPINADENRVQQILYNLVGNAIKFTDSGTITVSAEVIMAHGSTDNEKWNQDSGQCPIPDSQLAITVSDTGIGIPTEKLDRIFEAFEQADGSTGRIYGGTGLGLAVTQQLVNLHGGQMRVQSQVGVGSHFTFTLPTSEGKVEEAKPLAQLPTLLAPLLEIQPDAVESELPDSDSLDSLDSEKQSVFSLKGEFNILIVDDEAINRQVLVNHLSLQNNYSLNQAESGVEALALIEEDYKPDLIILDIMMPYLSGYEVTEKIRKTYTADELPIILLTAKNQVADLVIGLESGANDFLTKPVSKDELLARLKTHLNLLRLKRASLEVEKKLRYDATHDQLTGLFNRAAFTTRLSNALEKVSKVPDGNEVSKFPIINPKFPISFAVLFVDLDRFKIVNDSMGHLVGDQLLTEVAQRLNCVVSENYFVARFGGDEFALMLENISDKANLQECVNHILQQLGQPYTLNNDTFNTTASIGIALNNQKYENADELLRDADTAMYEAKKQGGNKFVIFQSGMHDNIVNMLRMERDLRKALEREEFRLYYQPIISLETRRTVGLEALVRWEHPEQGMISPELFIPLTEETGLIKELGLWVFDTACVQLRRWQTQFAHHANLGMNINVSPVQMKQSHLVRDIHDIIEKTGINPPTCRVEITEGAMMQNPKTALTILNDLKSLNVLLYIDDFGTGYSSLSYLQQFPIDALKIDKSFIEKIEASARSAQVVRAIIGLGKAFDLRVVAEGVENALQVSMLKLAHCNHLQGYFFSRPKDAQSIEAFLSVETHD